MHTMSSLLHTGTYVNDDNGTQPAVVAPYPPTFSWHAKVCEDLRHLAMLSKNKVQPFGHDDPGTKLVET